MSTQIAVRLPDALVAEIDRAIASGQAANRTSIVERALRRELRRLQAEADLRILQSSGDDEDLADMVAFASQQPMDLD